jgi:hypothetical protein
LAVRTCEGTTRTRISHATPPQIPQPSLRNSRWRPIDAQLSCDCCSYRCGRTVTETATEGTARPVA